MFPCHCALTVIWILSRNQGNLGQVGALLNACRSVCAGKRQYPPLVPKGTSNMPFASSEPCYA
eukprot:5079074-Amphidinium_carterae.1